MKECTCVSQRRYTVSITIFDESKQTFNQVVEVLLYFQSILFDDLFSEQKQKKVKSLASLGNLTLVYHRTYCEIKIIIALHVCFTRTVYLLFSQRGWKWVYSRLQCSQNCVYFSKPECTYKALNVVLNWIKWVFLQSRVVCLVCHDIKSFPGDLIKCNVHPCIFKRETYFSC